VVHDELHIQPAPLPEFPLIRLSPQRFARTGVSTVSRSCQAQMQSSGPSNSVQPVGGAVKESVSLVGQPPGPGSLGFRRVRRVDFSIENMEFSILGPDIGPHGFFLKSP
jgi:hypothetical protein